VRPSSWVLVLAAFVAAGTLVAVVVGSATADPTVASKQAQAQAVLAAIQASNAEAEQAANALYSANQELGRIDANLQLNTRHLAIARASLRVAQRRAAARLRALYMHGGSGGALAVFLGSESLDGLVNQLDTEQRVNRQDETVLHEVVAFRSEVIVRQTTLVRARSAQARLVAQRAAAKRSIQTQLAHQQQLLSSIQGEIASLRAAEARRQALLAQQSRQRYLAQQQQLQQQAALTGATSSALSAGPPPLEPAGTPPPAKYGNVVAIALQYLGVPYVWGGESPATGFDCSGLVAFVYAQVGVYLPHNAAAQYAYGVPVSRDQLEPGDLVFFDNLGHVGLYIGGGNFEQAPQTGDVVKITSLDDPWAVSQYYGARRIT
jgi:peptidoglycan DL-endopeptidase CwlO